MQRAILAHRFDRGDNVHGPAETGNQWMADDPVDCVERGRDRAPRTSLPRPSRARLHALFGQRARPGAKGETVHHVPRRNQGLEAAGFANPAQHLVVFRVSSPGESHPQALAEPYVTVSRHTAPADRLWVRGSMTQWAKSLGCRW